MAPPGCIIEPPARTLSPLSEFGFASQYLCGLQNTHIRKITSLCCINQTNTSSQLRFDIKSSIKSAATRPRITQMQHIHITSLLIIWTLSLPIQAANRFGPTRFTAQVLYFQESALVASGVLKYDWNSHEQRLELNSFNKKITEVTLFGTHQGTLKITQIDGKCSTLSTTSSVHQTQDEIFVSENATRVKEISGCGDLVPPYSQSPSRNPQCIQYRHDVGDLSYLVVWDSANNVIREARVLSGLREIRRYILLSQTPQATSFPPSTFSPSAGCQGAVFCPTRSAVCVALDGSESISPSEFSSAKQFAQRVLQTSEALESCVISFSHTSKIEAPLGPRARAIQTVSTLGRKSGLTDLASPLLVGQSILSRSAMESKYLVFISDGSSTFQSRSSALSTAASLRSSGVRVIAVSVGESKNDTALSLLAYSPSSNHRFAARDLNRIPQLNGALSEGVCDASLRTCSVGLTCGSGFALCNTCVCPSGELSLNCSPASGLSTGAIVGIVLAAIVAAALAGLLGWRLYAQHNANLAAPVAGEMINNVQENPLYQGGGDNYNPLYRPN